MALWSRVSLSGVIALGLFVSPLIQADEAAWKLEGFGALEARFFGETEKWPEQDGSNAFSIMLQPELRYHLQGQRFTFIPFYRYDTVDDERTHFDVRELHWRWIAEGHEWLIGINRVFWGVVESRHLIDIINQTDMVEDPDGEDKLGQPMLQYTHLMDSGAINLYVLPGFRERRFPGIEGRLRSAIPVDEAAAQYESSAKERRLDLALRYSQVLGDWDVGLGIFNGTSREPRFALNGTGDRLIPIYDIINQLSIDIQHTHEAWLWKLEAMAREGQGNTFTAFSAGLEYTFYQIDGKAMDLGTLFEYHYDGRDASAAPSFYDHDIFLGVRLAFNDIDDSKLLAGITLDDSGDDRFINLEAERRFSDHIKAELRLRLFSHAQANSILGGIEKDDYLQLQVRYYF